METWPLAAPRGLLFLTYFSYDPMNLTTIIPSTYFKLLFLFIVFAASGSDPVTYRKVPSGIEYTVDGLRKRISFYAPDMVRVSVVKQGNPFVDSSLAVVATEKRVSFDLKERRNSIVLSTDKLLLEVDQNNGVITFSDTEKQQYLSEHAQIPVLLSDTLLLDSIYYKIKQGFQLSESEGIYGLGQFQNGYMNYRSKDLLLVQENKVAVVPFLVSTKNYGILWDNYSHTKFHDGRDGMFFTSMIADQVDYYFIGSKSIDGVISGYRRLTGEAPLFPKKAYGFWQSKERYTSFDELHDVVKKYRENRIPIDNIVQDWRYWGDNDFWSSMYFSGENYANPAQNIQKLHDSHVNVMVSIWPSVGPSSELYNDLQSKGFLYELDHWSGGKVYDAYNPEARKIYWSHIKNGLAKYGVDAYWMDGTEPEFSHTNDQENTEREILRVGRTAAGPIAKYLNTYALVTSEGLYKEHLNLTQDKRVFILTRSSWAGQQRNATATWSGDVSASYENFKKQISAGINFCMAGVPYWTHDIGAFFPTGAGGQYPKGIEDPAYQELYVRWFQFGAFTPIFRSHGTGTPREVWQFKDRNPLFYDALVKAVNLRYRLYPYVYSNAWQITSNDYTLMRGLAMDFSHDTRVYNISDQYMFGPSILVKPVTRNMYYENPKNISTIPQQNLFTRDNTPGLNVTYFKDVSLTRVVFKGTDKTIDHNWAGGGMPQGVPANNFSVRWEGVLVPEEEGEYIISFTSDDGVRMWIDDDLVVDEWYEQAETTFKHAMELKKGRRYPIKVEYFQGGGEAVAKLGWEKKSASEMGVQMSKEENVYLPEHTGWFDFWSNSFHDGGQTITGKFPIDIFPLYVKVGSIIPLATVQQYADEKPNDPITIKIYAGEDAAFTYYEDEGDNYNYKEDAFNTIEFKWEEKGRTLKIGPDTGTFAGYNPDKSVEIELVEYSKATNEVTTSMKSIYYTGDSAEIKF